MKYCKQLIIFMLIAVLTVSFGCSKKKDHVQTVFLGKNFPYYLGKELEITDAYLFNGVFPEDGSFSEKEGVFTLEVKNIAEKDLQLVRIYVTTNLKEYFFEITTLPAGKSVTVMEKSAATVADEGEGILKIRDEDMAFFNEAPSLHEELFEITPLEGMLNIKNVSNVNITSDVYVYYKKIDKDGSYFGGITFRTKAGTMDAGQFRQIPASAFRKADSEVVFVTYAPQ